ncbi:MAG TPA: hypothetical protein VD735_05525, partial [Candidatus Saccharimonadales bacterium]|nr:hypothetical protein [Candidatus Saccharimonadales bacterium]
MIRMRDATTLAFTKLRTRKVRLIVTIVISGLLFSILAGASMISRGVFSSVQDFSKEGLGDRFLVQAMPATFMDMYRDPDLIAKADTLHKESIARKKAEAKRLGLEYSPDAERPPVEEYDTPNGKERTLNSMNPIAAQVINDHIAANPGPNTEALQEEGKKYGQQGVYESRRIGYDLQGAQLKVLAGGEEKFEETNKNQGGPSSGIDSFVSSWSVMSSDLLKPFVLPGETLEKGTDGSMPVVVPLSAAEQILKMKKLPATASDEAQIQHLKDIRS